MSGAADSEHIAEMFAGFGPVSVRRMFGGAGIFADGLMIGLVSGGVIFLKADEAEIPRFEHEGMSAFSYRSKHGMRTINSFWRLPERLYDDPDELADWAARALAAARRADVRPARKAAGSAGDGKGRSRPRRTASRVRPKAKKSRAKARRRR